MTGAAGAAFQVVEAPRLPLDRLFELRALLDCLLASPAGDSSPVAGGDDGQTDVHSARPVRPCPAAAPTTAGTASRPRDAAATSGDRGRGAGGSGRQRQRGDGR